MWKVEFRKMNICCSCHSSRLTALLTCDCAPVASASRTRLRCARVLRSDVGAGVENFSWMYCAFTNHTHVCTKHNATQIHASANDQPKCCVRAASMTSRCAIVTSRSSGRRCSRWHLPWKRAMQTVSEIAEARADDDAAMVACSSCASEPYAPATTLMIDSTMQTTATAKAARSKSTDTTADRSY